MEGTDDEHAQEERSLHFTVNSKAFQVVFESICVDDSTSQFHTYSDPE